MTRDKSSRTRELSDPFVISTRWSTAASIHWSDTRDGAVARVNPPGSVVTTSPASCPFTPAPFTADYNLVFERARQPDFNQTSGVPL